MKALAIGAAFVVIFVLAIEIHAAFSVPLAIAVLALPPFLLLRGHGQVQPAVAAAASFIALVMGVIAGLLGSAVSILGVPGNFAFCFVPALPFVLAGRFARATPIRSALMAAGFGFAAVLAYFLLYFAISGVEDRSADPFCDEICITRAEMWRVLAIIGVIVAALVALVSGIIAFIIAPPAKYPQATA